MCKAFLIVIDIDCTQEIELHCNKTQTGLGKVIATNKQNTVFLNKINHCILFN